MTIDKKTIEKISKLARLKLTETEKGEMVDELNAILKWVDQLQQVNTEGVPQMFGHSGMTLPFRKDVVSDGNIRDGLLKNAPEQDYGCFVVPKVIE